MFLSTRVRFLIAVRAWRVSAAEPFGAQVWFDPFRETPLLLAKPPPDGECDDAAIPVEYLPFPRLGPNEGGGGSAPYEGGESKGKTSRVHQVKNRQKQALFAFLSEEETN